jgi:hypothetical protein
MSNTPGTGAFGWAGIVITLILVIVFMSNPSCHGTKDPRDDTPEAESGYHGQ